MKRPGSLSLVVPFVLTLLGGCHGDPDACSGNGCVAGEPAVFSLACAPADLTSVETSGPCALFDASPSNYVQGGSYVYVRSAGAGTCHVQLTFAGGFTYAADVTFTTQPQNGIPGCPPCGPLVVPSQSSFTVAGPDGGCADASPGVDATSGG